jgi:uncharacterized protein (DUF1800 family)
MSEAGEFPAKNFSRDQAVLHLLNRAAYGARPGEVTELRPPGQLELWFENQLYPERISDARVQSKLEKLSNYRMSAKDLLKNYSIKDPDAKAFAKVFSMVKEIGFQKLILAAESNRQLEQVMVDFWFNHFSVDVKFPHYLPSYERDVIRAHVFGKFGDMLVASAQSPAMLYYLGNWESAKQGAVTSAQDEKVLDWPSTPAGINENYARELLELHTVGINGGYSQSDVEKTALVFTGWTIAQHRFDPHFVFMDSWHDQSDVVILGKHLHGKDGIEEGRAFLQFLALKTETAHFLSEKLCRHFVQDPPSIACIDRLSAKYLQSQGDLREVYRTLFTSPDFWEKTQASQRMKKPFEFVVSGLRAMGSDIQVSTQAMDDYYDVMTKSGETPYFCPMPNGYSDANAVWSSPTTVLARSLSSSVLVGLAHPSLKLNGESLTTQLREAIAEPVSSETKNEIERALRESQNQALAVLVDAPEFQRR